MASGEPDLNRPSAGNWARQRLGNSIRSNISDVKSLFRGRNTETITLGDDETAALNDGDAVNKLVTITNTDDNEIAQFHLEAGANSVTMLGQTGTTKLLGDTNKDVSTVSSQTTNTFTLSVLGAATGDEVAVAPPSGINTSLVVSAFVSSSDTVTVQVTNPTSGDIDPASGTYNVRVFQRDIAFTPFSGADGFTNVYWDAGNSQYEIENKTNGKVTYDITYEGA